MSKQMVCDYSNDILKFKMKYIVNRKGDRKKIVFKCSNCNSRFVKNSFNPFSHFETKKCKEHGVIDFETAMSCLNISMVYYTNASYKTNRIVYIGDKELHKKYNKKYYKAVEVISKWYLNKKYDPQYKACRDRMDKLYSELE